MKHIGLLLSLCVLYVSSESSSTSTASSSSTTTSAAQPSEDNCKYADNCNAEKDRMFTVSCAKDGECTCVDESDDENPNTGNCPDEWQLLDDDVTYDNIPGKCKELCEDVASASGESLECSFYKYNQDIIQQVKQVFAYQGLKRRLPEEQPNTLWREISTWPETGRVWRQTPNNFSEAS